MSTKTLYARLAAAQKTFKPAIKDADNPYFKSKYADLGAVWDACKDALAENGLFVSQPTGVSEIGELILNTYVYDESGESINSQIKVVAKNPNDPQAVGSALTYYRRYSLAAILGIVTEDDDANEAAGNNSKAKTSEDATKQLAEQAEEKKRLEAQKSEIKSILSSEHLPQEKKDKTMKWLPTATNETAAQMIAKLRQEIATIQKGSGANQAAIEALDKVKK
jgi:hypothetical protein